MHQILAFLFTAEFLSPKHDPVKFLSRKALKQRVNKPKLPRIFWIMGMSGTNHNTLTEYGTVAELFLRDNEGREGEKKEKTVSTTLLNLMHHI